MPQECRRQEDRCDRGGGGGAGFAAGAGREEVPAPFHPFSSDIHRRRSYNHGSSPLYVGHGSRAVSPFTIGDPPGSFWYPTPGAVAACWLAVWF
jgi:hypothetical protein